MIRRVALGLTVLTGFSGLVYEVTWQRYLAILLGSHGTATAAVLGIFLGGLALGYRLFAHWTRSLVRRAEATGSPPGLLRFYGLVEGCIGLYALVFPVLFRGAQAVSLAFPQGSPGLGFTFDVLLTALLIGPPTVLMGGTIPVLTQALARDLDDATPVHALIYASNTAGAFLGALAAGFFLVPWLGLAGVMLAMGALNLLAAVSFWLLGHRREVAASLPAAGPDSEIRVTGFASFAVAAGLAGFAMMALQTTLNRLGALAMGSSPFTFASVVSVFVLCIALGSFAVSTLRRVRPAHLIVSQWLLVALLCLLYAPLGDVTYWGHFVRTWFQSHPLAFYPYHVAVSLCLLLVFAVPIGLSGALLPLIFHHLRRSVGDLGSVAGRLYGWNTVGSLLGALLGGYWLLFWFDLDAIYRLSVLVLAAGASVLTVRLVRRPMTVLIPLLPVLGFVVLQQPWDPQRLSAGLFRAREPTPQSSRGPDAVYDSLQARESLVFYDDGPTASIAVRSTERPGKPGEPELFVLTNGKSDSGTVTDYPTTAMLALVPALFADDCADGFIIGYGTGVTAGELARLECSRRVQVAEIANGVIEAAPLFDAANFDTSHNPEVEIVRGDAYRTLLRSERSFDLIVSEPSNPWVSGVENLYAREFLEAARGKLRPGGVYCQWFHVYEMDEPTVELVLRTFDRVFEHSSVWFTLGSDLLLLGFENPEAALNLERLAIRAARPDFGAGLQRAGIGNVETLLAHEILPLGVVRAARFEGPPHTLLDPILSHQAARAFFLGRNAGLPPTAAQSPAEVGRRNSLLRRWAARSPDAGPETFVAAARESCRHAGETCLALLGRWQWASPESADRDALIPRLRGITRRGVTNVARFFDPSRADAPELVTPKTAERATAEFEDAYHHATPFDRTFLARLWARCADGTPANTRCAAARQRVESRLGSLGSP